MRRQTTARSSTRHRLGSGRCSGRRAQALGRGRSSQCGRWNARAPTGLSADWRHIHSPTPAAPSLGCCTPLATHTSCSAHAEGNSRQGFLITHPLTLSQLLRALGADQQPPVQVLRCQRERYAAHTLAVHLQCSPLVPTTRFADLRRLSLAAHDRHFEQLLVKVPAWWC